MPIEIQLPRLGWSMEEGTLVAWLKEDGDYIKQGEPLFTIEGDKAAQDVEATDSGFLRLAPDAPKEGETVQVGRILGWLLAEAETASPAHAEASEKLTAADSENTQMSPAEPGISTPTEPGGNASPSAGLPESAGDSVPASPRARRAARQHHVDLSKLSPTGQGGRIRERDVLAAAAATPSASGFKKVPLTPQRRTIAARLMHSRQTTVPVTITGRCDATQLVTLRAQLKATGSSLVPSFTDILLKLTAAALRQHPMLAATWAEDHLLLPEFIHLGLAVDAGAGLLVPVIRDVESSSLMQIATQSQKLIAAARAGQLAAADMQGACFTLTNLGGLGVEAFTPVINPPESAILGIGAIVREAVPLDDGRCTARDRFTLSLTFDHRVNDGAAAARFLQTLRHLIEQPLLGLE